MDHAIAAKDDLGKISILHEGISGFLLGLFSVAQVIACAMIIFNGPLIDYLPIGINVALVSSFIIGLFICIRSGSSTMVGSIEEVYCVVSAVILSSIYTSLHSASPNIDPLPTLIAAFTTLTLFFGVSMYLLGRFNLGKLIRFIPYPVISGYLAGTGWLLLLVGFRVVTKNSLGWDTLMSSVNDPLFLPALLALAYTVMVFIIVNRYKNLFLLYILIAIAFIAFYIIIYFCGISIKKAHALDLLLNIPQHDVTFAWTHYAPIFSLFNKDSLSAIQWHLLFNNLMQYIILVVLASIEFFLNISAIELTQKRELDVNYELKIAGVASFFSGMLGGFGGYHQATGSSFNHFLGVKTRLSGLAFLAVFVVVLVSEISIFNLFPKVIFGMLIFYSGIWFLYDALILSWKRDSWFDYMSILVIFFCIIWIDLLTGFVVGLVMAVIMFTMSYSRIRIIHAVFDGHIIKSNVERQGNQEEWLRSIGKIEYILILNGFLFFGNINYVVNKIKKRVHLHTTPCRFVILDCSMVSGIDSSATLILIKLMEYLREHDVEIVFCALPDTVKYQLDDLAKNEEYNVRYHLMDDLDHALESVENQLLEQQGIGRDDLLQKTDKLWEIISAIDAAGPYFERISVDPHQIIYHKRDVSDGFYYIESGSVDVVLPQKHKPPIRIRKMQKGTIIGEIGMYVGRNRTATVVATEACILLYLSTKQLAMLEKAEPQLAQSLNHVVIQILATRLEFTNQLLEILKRTTLGDTKKHLH